MTELLQVAGAEEVRTVLAQSLWLQRLSTPAPDGAAQILELAWRLLSEGHPLPSPGFLADLVVLAAGAHDPAAPLADRLEVPGFPGGLLRAYEDHVLGRLEADTALARARDALVRYRDDEDDQARARAFLVHQVHGRVGFAGLEVSPPLVRGLLDLPPQEVLALGWHSLAHEGPHPVLVRLYESLVTAFRMAPDLLAPEDVFELESGTAVAEFGERVALRQLLQAARLLGEAVHRPRAPARTAARAVPTHLLHEDAYPVGGFSSLATRGSLESLLHSQLVYMDPADRPDLFDIKFVRDELLYYARDDNEFLRHRLTFVFALHPSLRLGRVKDPALPYQRGLLALGLVVALVRRLVEWCGTEALQFRVLFLAAGEDDPLARERALVELVLQELTDKGLVHVEAEVSAETLTADWAAQSRRAICHGLMLSVEDDPGILPEGPWSRLLVDGPVPVLVPRVSPPAEPEDDLLAGWIALVQDLLDAWM